jgi:hypothetical protein
MIHLSYHPAFDAYNAIFRFLRIKIRDNIETLEFDKLRILDYYLLFPWRASNVRLLQQDLDIRRVAKALEAKKDYAVLPTGEVLLERMKSAHTAAIQTLVKDGYVLEDRFKIGVVAFTDQAIPLDIAARIAERNGQEPEVMTIIDRLKVYSLMGNDGLKGRTALLEYRYDKI